MTADTEDIEIGPRVLRSCFDSRGGQLVRALGVAALVLQSLGCDRLSESNICD